MYLRKQSQRSSIAFRTYQVYMRQQRTSKSNKLELDRYYFSRKTKNLAKLSLEWTNVLVRRENFSRRTLNEILGKVYRLEN